MNITIVGTGYVGLVTGVSLAEIGHRVNCFDIDEDKIKKLGQGISPIYECGLQRLILKNINENQLFFTANKQEAFLNADAVYIAVGTPENDDGSANLTYVEEAAKVIASQLEKDSVIVIKSTVPVGTNEKVEKIINAHLVNNIQIDMASNPEFLREGSALDDSFYGDRIVIGTSSEKAVTVLEEINKPFRIPIYKTDIKSAEMIKYASNAFLATKISFINEISNICELLDANIEDVAKGMGMDKRIGSQFLKAGIGYGGSCFPKDTKALIQIAGNLNYDFELLKGVINVNRNQQVLLIKKLKAIYPTLVNKKIAVLGLAFKPNTDDVRESPAILVTEELIKHGAKVLAYDPIAMEKAKLVLNASVQYRSTIEETILNSEAVLILTDWDEIKNMNLELFKTMKNPLVIDGRNCFSLNEVKRYAIDYYSIGRPSVERIITKASV
ncbi:UDP-glucose dehydrogenase family protein [Planococcus sp. YIM B11945]|uniref:UDP-glucose dehydrogenase family protein n=1 Tax=Planococcus sp. YIM B11945 TaxID=3435410 RepID=UPI003D7E2470